MEKRQLKDKIMTTVWIDGKLMIDYGGISGNIHSGLELANTKDIKLAIEYFKELIYPNFNKNGNHIIETAIKTACPDLYPKK